MQHKSSVFGAALLIAGTTIGGGMLALPLATAEGGFLPALLFYFLTFLFMTATGFLVAEVFLWSKEEVNIISMSSQTLGKWGKLFTWVLYLFFFYSLMVAFLAAGGRFFVGFFEFLGPSSAFFSILLFLLLAAPVVVIGPWAVDRLNSIFMAGLILSFILFIVLGVPHLRLPLLADYHFSQGIFGLPVMFTAFGFQGIVPSMTQYLNRDRKKIRLAILIGSSIALCVYVLFQALILGTVDRDILLEAKKLGQTAIYPLKSIVQVSWFYWIGGAFAFFALITTCLGISLSLIDFLADGLKVKKTFIGRLKLALLVFIPPFVFAIFNPTIFISALQWAGGIGSALLLGFLPIAMAFCGKYIKKLEKTKTFFTHWLFLLILFLFLLLELIVMNLLLSC